MDNALVEQTGTGRRRRRDRREKEGEGLREEKEWGGGVRPARDLLAQTNPS
jgi:hypothetical protein